MLPLLRAYTCLGHSAGPLETQLSTDGFVTDRRRARRSLAGSRASVASVVSLQFRSEFRQLLSIAFHWSDVRRTAKLRAVRSPCKQPLREHTAGYRQYQYRQLPIAMGEFAAAALLQSAFRRRFVDPRVISQFPGKVWSAAGGNQDASHHAAAAASRVATANASIPHLQNLEPVSVRDAGIQEVVEDLTR